MIKKSVVPVPLINKFLKNSKSPSNKRVRTNHFYKEPIDTTYLDLKCVNIAVLEQWSGLSVNMGQSNNIID